ncbi:MAG TPA: hypothetical protein VNW47_14700 [Terriglobales bacterium]|nr:hypothetical protein [Terriglobales bacterium]
MNWLIDVSWVAGPALQIVLLTFMVQRKAQSVFPRFFSYIVFQVLKSAVLFVTFRYFPDNYFDAYWTGNAISVLLAVAVMDEILNHLLKQYGGIQTLGVTIFRWACGLLLLLAIVGAPSSQDGSTERIVAAVLAFERSVRLMQCGLFVLLMLLCRVLKDNWRQPVFGIALGYGIFASVEVILISFVMFGGESHGSVVSLIKSAAFNAVTLIWIGYLRREGELVPALNLRPVEGLNLALATASPGGDEDESFMVWVEQAVDRVLSRHTWPAASSKGSQIVGREPGPEEKN